jgi:hypothetical protein
MKTTAGRGSAVGKEVEMRRTGDGPRQGTRVRPDSGARP